MRPPIEGTIAQLEGWIESNHRERDRMTLVLVDPDASDIQRAFATSRLLFLEQELKQTRKLLRKQQAMRYTPQLMFTKRPMLKLPGRPAKRKTA